MYDLSNKMTFEQRSRGEGVNCVDTEGKHLPDRGGSLCKGEWHQDQLGCGVEGAGDCGRRLGQKKPD